MKAAKWIASVTCLVYGCFNFVSGVRFAWMMLKYSKQFFVFENALASSPRPQLFVSFFLLSGVVCIALGMKGLLPVRSNRVHALPSKGGRESESWKASV